MKILFQMLVILWISLIANAFAQKDAAQQFLFFDDILVQDSTGFPLLTRLGPENLESPVNFPKGNIYIRFEIIEKPSDLPLRPSLFFWQEGHKPKIAIVGVRKRNLQDLTEKGVYYIDYQNPDAWWHGDHPIPDWTRPFDRMALVPWVSESNEQFRTLNCGSHCYTGGDIALHTPIVYRATAIWVAPGKTLIPPSNWDCPPEWKVDAKKSFGTREQHSPKKNNELLLIDKVFVHDNSDSMDKTMGFSGFKLPANVPDNWEKPIQYSEGTVYFQASVLTKPTEKPIQYQMGFQWADGANKHKFLEKFPDKKLMRITSPGIYKWSQPIPEWWEPSSQKENPINWSAAPTRLLMVIWNDESKIIDDRWGHGFPGMNLEDCYPMTVHFQAVLVPPGEEFGGWENYSITQP